MSFPAEPGWSLAARAPSAEYTPAHVLLPVQQHRQQRVTISTDHVAEEVPVCLRYNGESYAVMMCTPQDLEDFALGFSLTEGLLESADELEALAIEHHPEGVVIAMTVPATRASALAGDSRHLAGRTGCGMCGVRSLAAAVRRPPLAAAGLVIRDAALARAQREIHAWQAINAATGAIHAAAWATVEGEIVAAREDVGRHNALDKLVGYLTRARIDTTAGFAVITSRASYEMVSKAAMAGITLLAAVSAPTALAVRLAKDAGLTLAGFLRQDGFVLYTHPQRVQTSRQEAATVRGVS